jgi:lactoylglutathione lyase
MAESGRLGWVIVYVPDVEAAVALYERAFGLARRFVGDGFAELETGATALAFASDEVAGANLGAPFERPGLERPPANLELALIFDDVPAAFERAVAAGCTGLAQPSHKPHGQTVAYVRDPWGTLVEIATPVG